MTVQSEKVPESVISAVLIGGLILSVVVAVFGILAYHAQSGGFNFEFTQQWRMTGQNFFAYFLDLLDSISVWTPTTVMAFGIVLLMLTSYVRVLSTLLYFVFAKNLKYSLISLFLFAVLTVALIER